MLPIIYGIVLSLELFAQIIKYVKNIGQYTKEGILLNTFNSLSDASRKTGINYRYISVCLKGHSKYGKGYIWKYL